MEMENSVAHNSMGRLDASARDGDAGAKEGPATVCPEASSINNVNSPEVGQLAAQSPTIRERELQPVAGRVPSVDRDDGVQQGRTQPLNPPVAEPQGEDHLGRAQEGVSELNRLRNEKRKKKECRKDSK
ncbi:hypothetical protein NLI96_g12500 [Meripilus lineatus]|uniref:Uncharacterized protein n=1 Tax=Meripilus lineatus TaxID=2056292 RepID=A0AAD5YCC1_9APHY|nr:hypothetical protein NLI96_g12500 [Physisporinus lineatus]